MQSKNSSVGYSFIKTSVTCSPHSKDRQKQKGCKLERVKERKLCSAAESTSIMVPAVPVDAMWMPCAVHQLRLVERRARLLREQLFGVLLPLLPLPPHWLHVRQARRKQLHVAVSVANSWSQFSSAFQLAFHCGAARTCLGNATGLHLDIK